MTQTNDIKKIRGFTGAGVMDIKKALDQAGGDLKKALAILKEMAGDKAQKKLDRIAKAGLVEAYSHEGRIGVLIEVNCETDFVARNPDFKNLVHNLALQIAAMAPNDAQALLAEPYVKDESMTVAQLVDGNIAKLGEKIVINRIERFELGE